MNLLLAAMGWEPIGQDVRDTLAKHKRIILVYPHTCREDLLIYIPYFLSDPVFSSRCRALVGPGFIDSPIIRPVSKILRCIRAPHRSDRGVGATAIIKKELESMESFIFLISPKGCTDNHPWRSGYYHLAKQLKATIVPGGFDFIKHKFVIKEGFEVGDMTLEQTTSRAQAALRDICPLIIENLEYPHDFGWSSIPTLIDGWRWTVLYLILALIVIFIAWCLYSLWWRWRGS